MYLQMKTPHFRTLRDGEAAQAHAAGVTFHPGGLAKSYALPTGLPSARDGVVAIVELGGGYRASDFVAAAQLYGHPAPALLPDISVDGARNSPGGDADAEVVLDGQIAAAVYSYMTGRAAKIQYVFCQNTGVSFANGITAALKSGASTISISWGAPEDAWSASDVRAMEAAFAACKAAGVPAFCASGDNDSGDGESGDHVDYPAASPNAVGVGGTSASLSGASLSEKVWNTGRGEGTGGGYSALFAAPAYQPGFKGRGVPDVAAVADPATGYVIVLNGKQSVVGGTSCASPFWAGAFAAMRGAGMAQGDVHQMLYAGLAPFRDVVAGNNGTYKAGAGWDACTGQGTPNGAAWLSAFGGTAPPPPPPPPPVSGKLTVTLSIDPAARTGTMTII